MTNRLESLWAELAAIVGAGPCAFAPLGEDELAALQRHYHLPAWFEGLMRAGYPACGLDVFGTKWFSSPNELIRYIQRSPAVASWFPVEICEGHVIHVVGDEPGALGQVDMESDDALEWPREPSRFGSLERVLETLLVLVPLERAHGTREPTRGMITRAGEEVLVRALGPERAEDVCELFHIDRVSRERAQVERALRRSNGLAFAMAALTFVAGACAFVLPRGPWVAVLGVVAFNATLVGIGAWLGSFAEKKQLRALVRADVFAPRA